jgi:hypothetical protein
VLRVIVHGFVYNPAAADVGTGVPQRNFQVTVPQPPANRTAGCRAMLSWPDPSCASPAVIPAGQDLMKFSIQAVHQGLAFIDAARPAHGQGAPGA